MDIVISEYVLTKIFTNYKVIEWGVLMEKHSWHQLDQWITGQQSLVSEGLALCALLVQSTNKNRSDLLSFATRGQLKSRNKEMLDRPFWRHPPEQKTCALQKSQGHEKQGMRKKLFQTEGY